MNSLSDAIKEAYAIAPVTKVILHTLEIHQDGVQDPVYLVQSRRSLSAKDEHGIVRHFEPSGFQFSLPPSNHDGYQSLNLAIDNIGRRTVDFVKTALTQPIPVQVTYRPYLSDDLTQPQMTPPLVLYLKDVKITSMKITGTCTFMDIINKKFPAEIYNHERFPTLG